MFDHDTHQSIELTILWIWLGFIAVGAVCYWLLRPWLRKAHKAPPPTPKYADRLQQRMRKKPAGADAAASDAAKVSPPDLNRKAKRRP